MPTNNCKYCNSKYITKKDTVESFECTTEKYYCRSCKKSFEVKTSKKSASGQWLMTIYSRKIGNSYERELQIYKTESGLELNQKYNGKITTREMFPEFMVHRNEQCRFDDHYLWVNTFTYFNDKDGGFFGCDLVKLNPALTEDALKYEAMSIVHTKDNEFEIGEGYSEDTLLKDIAQWFNATLREEYPQQKARGKKKPMTKSAKAAIIVSASIVLLVLVGMVAIYIDSFNKDVDIMLDYVINDNEYWDSSYSELAAIERIDKVKDFEEGLLEGVRRLEAEGNMAELCRVADRLEWLKYHKDSIKEQLHLSIQNILKNDSENITRNLSYIAETLDVDEFEFYNDASVYINRDVVTGVLTDQKKAAFASTDPMEFFNFIAKIDTLFWDPRVSELISEADILPYEEVADHIRKNCTLTVTDNGKGGYYDAKREEYVGSFRVDETLTTHQQYYGFYGDFMIGGSIVRQFRPTGEAWEEELLSKYDKSTVNYYYKDVEVFGDEKFPYELQSGEVYVREDGDSYHVFIIQENAILARSGIAFDLEYDK